MRVFRAKVQKNVMATIEIQKTKFTFSILPLPILSNGFWAKTETEIKNDYLSYHDVSSCISREELEDWLVSMHRLLAGAYSKEYSLSFEKAGLAIDFYPYTENGEEASRLQRRENDCVMAIRLLFREKRSKRFIGGVYTLLLHRAEIEQFASDLRQEFDAVFSRVCAGKGTYLFVGVSPKGYKGCYYWYLDPSESVQAGDYVWVRMGRHNTEQIVYVDGVRRCTQETAPYDPIRVKQVLRKATDEELKA